MRAMERYGSERSHDAHNLPYQFPKRVGRDEPTDKMKQRREVNGGVCPNGSVREWAGLWVLVPTRRSY